jgi:prolyl-tRNA editing enzyme YbaK/EbsC (Cys-tRNA(Pro) deacylase)
MAEAVQGEPPVRLIMPSLEAVKHFLAGRGIQVLEFSRPTPTAETAAFAVGCSMGEIAKTILFLVGGQPVAVVTAGDTRVNSSRLKQAAALTGKVRLPAADEVLHHTGYAPGGVCPFLLPEDLPVLVDRSLRRFPVVYPAAGNDRSGVPITVDQLLDITGGREVDVCGLVL